MVNRDTRALDGLDVEVFKGDIRNNADVHRAVDGVDLVYHLAGLISLDGDWEQLSAVNITGVRNVVQACIEKRVSRLVHFSSIHVFDPGLDGALITEDSPRVDGEWPACYDRSKAGGEREIRLGIERGLDAVILNPTGVIGRYDFKPSMFGSGVMMIARGLFPVLVKGGFNWVDAADVAEFAIIAAQNAPRGSQYIVGGEWRSVEDIAAVVSELYQRRPPKIYLPTGAAAFGLPLTAAYALLAGKRNIFTRLTLDALSSSAQVSDQRARTEMGYQSRSFEETIRDAVSWFSQQGMLPPLPEMEGN
jgi:dihydroflavonol-4-reductase